MIVPDIDPNGGRPNLSGKLSRSNLEATKKKAYFAGILTSTKKMKMDEDLDYLIIVSGPEPQRTKLEEIILKQVTKLPGEKVVLLGSPQKDFHSKLDEHTTVHSYLSTDEKVELMNRARFLITRSGYTTMMEMVELDKKHGLFHTHSRPDRAGVPLPLLCQTGLVPLPQPVQAQCFPKMQRRP